MLVSHNKERNGVRTYEFYDANDALRFCILFDAKIDAYSYHEVSGKTIHKYIISI